MPDIWIRGTLGDIATNHRRTLDSSLIPAETPYIGLEHMPRRSIALSNWGSANSIQSSKFQFQKGEILFGKLRPYFHKVGVAALDGVCSTDILVVAPRIKSYWGLVAFTLSSDEFVQYTDRASAGTRMPRTNWADMSRFELAIPPEESALAFNNVVEPMVHRIMANIFESRTLATIRDTLLPKLLSGEVRVKQAEKLVEDAV
jgi:type I restriction enzyme S subunit